MHVCAVCEVIAKPIMQAFIRWKSQGIFVMSLEEAVDRALATYDMSRSEEAEETGRTVATLQD